MATKLFEDRHELVRVTVVFTREHFYCWRALVEGSADSYPMDSEALVDFFYQIFSGHPPEPGKLPNFVQAIHDSRPEGPRDAKEG